jgi:hypothetical protein
LGSGHNTTQRLPHNVGVSDFSPDARPVLSVRTLELRPSAVQKQAEMNAAKVRTAGRWLRVAARHAAWRIGSLVADRKHDRTPPPGNWIPNSNGEGGKVISSGHPGGN